MVEVILFNIDLGRNRNAGLRSCMKRDGQAISYCLLVHGGYFKTLGGKNTVLLGKKS